MMNLFDLTGKKAIVTGASRGLGRAIAEGYMKSGAETVLVASGAAAAEEAAAGYREKGFKCHAVAADLRDEAARSAGFEKALALLGGRLDILVNCAGAMRRCKSEDYSLEDWNLLIDVNLTATFRRKSYTVRFYANDGTTAKKEQTMEVGVSSPLIANTWERDQYTFMGWATSSDGAVEYDDGETVTDLSTEDGAVVSLYAVWQHIEPSNPGVMQFKRWDGSANERFTYGDMKRIEDAVNKLLSCIQMPTVTFNTPPSAGSPLDYRDMATIESKTSKMASVRGLTISAFTEWYVGYMLTFADIERIESNLYAIYQNFGGTTPRTDA